VEWFNTSTITLPGIFSSYISNYRISNTKVLCSKLYANIQGSKNQQCPFYHRVIDSNQRKKGKIVQLECQCIFHYYFPHFINDKPSSEYMAIVCYGQHDHPPPPAICIDSTIKNELVRVVHAFGGSVECTAWHLIASPMLPIMLNGQTELTESHIVLFNQDALNHILRKM